MTRAPAATKEGTTVYPSAPDPPAISTTLLPVLILPSIARCSRISPGTVVEPPWMILPFFYLGIVVVRKAEAVVEIKPANFGVKPLMTPANISMRVSRLSRGHRMSLLVGRLIFTRPPASPVASRPSFHVAPSIRSRSHLCLCRGTCLPYIHLGSQMTNHHLVVCQQVADQAHHPEVVMMLAGTILRQEFGQLV